MSTPVHVLYVIIGVIGIVIVIDAAIRTFVVPRGTVVRFTVTTFQALRFAFNLFLRTRRTYESRDRVMALYAPIALLTVPIVSLIVVFIAYAFIYTGLENHGWRDAFITSGSSLLTLGFERPPDMPSTLVAFSEALVGLSLLALVIAYLPVIYGAFSRREVAVTDLSIRAGNPPTPLEFLTRAHLTGFLYDMDDFWASWMMWFTEVQETHTSYGALPLFRSPNANRSWVIAAGAVMDTASIRMSTLDMPWTPQAPLMIRSGFMAFREIAGFYGFDYDDDPAPDDPISITRDEFDEVCNKLGARGVPLKEDRDQSWADFAGWRVNYDAVLLTIATFVSAPYAPWVSDRSPVRPLPYHPRGRKRRDIVNRAGRQTPTRPEKDPPR
jgi:hypothetical protein